MTTFWQHIGGMVGDVVAQFDDVHFSMKIKNPLVILKVTIRKNHDKIIAVRHVIDMANPPVWSESTRDLIGKVRVRL